MRKILLFASCFISSISFSQMLNKNYVWNDLEGLFPLCKSTECSGPFYSTHSYHLGKDTTINSKTYNVLIDTLYYTRPSAGSFVQGVDVMLVGSIREDVAMKKVYFMSSNTKSEILLYDFSLSLGNVFNIRSGCVFNDSVYNVTNIDSTVYLGHKYLTITIANSYSSYNWIEGIGSKQGFLYFNESCPVRTLLCVKSNNDLLYKNDLGYDCIKSENVRINQVAVQSDLKVYPNPANEYIVIEQNRQIKSINIIDLYGHSLAQFNPKTSLYRISLTNFQKGIYFIKIDNTINKLIIE